MRYQPAVAFALSRKVNLHMKTSNLPDFEETELENFHEMETEEQITMILAELPDDVVQAIEDYEIARSVDRDRLLELATIALARLSLLEGFMTREGALNGHRG